MENVVFTKPFDAVSMVATVLKRLKAYDLSSLDNRIRCQKLQYLAQVFKVSPTYSFSLYLRGPYSPDLTKDLFAARDNIKLSEVIRFASEELEARFIKLEKLVKTRSIRELELIATLHWLVSEAKYSQVNAIKKLIEIKKASEEETRFTQRALQEIPA